MSHYEKAALWEVCLALAAGLVLMFVLLGCASVPRIQWGKATVEAPKDAGTPAQLKSGEVKTGFRIPAKSRMTVEKTEAVPATAETPARPAVEVTTFDFSEPTQFEQIANTMQASTGTVDTSVAKKRIETESKAPLLYAAIGAALAAVVAMVLKWPSVALLCGIGSGAFFAAWRLADIPWWAGLIALTAGGALMLGYKRAEWDANGDLIPDKLQKPSA
jgi:hypothetical protein